MTILICALCVIGGFLCVYIGVMLFMAQENIKQFHKMTNECHDSIMEVNETLDEAQEALHALDKPIEITHNVSKKILSFFNKTH